MRLINVCGARPNFMKIAPLMEAYKAHPSIQPMLVHTGQHYDERMSKLFFEELHIPRPDINLEVGSGSHAQQTATIMQRFEPVVLEHKPDAVLVVGDVNSTIACAMVASKLGVAVFHVEAGLRSFDRTMPEEINRLLTDAISDLLFVSEVTGLENLRKEGVPAERVHFVGNVMIDTLMHCRARAESSKILAELGLSRGQYVLVTLHRPAAVDSPAVMGDLLGVLAEVQRDMPVVFPIHPRTRKMIETHGLRDRVQAMSQLKLIDPVGYLDFLKLTMDARVVMTDSGGIQEETTILNVPCLTMRENTERPVTISEGTNRLVGLDPKVILAAYREAIAGRNASSRRPDKWDGHAAERIAEIIARWSR
jgi:UDP-N-acetylglucosamine 2-epimerase (non-hydrolysing)